MNETPVMCRFCEVLTPATTFYHGRPCCEDCLDYGMEQDYNEQQAEENYQRMRDEESLMAEEQA